MAKEYIEREKAIEWFMAFVHMDESDIPAETVISDLKYAIPAADVAPVRHGRWIEHKHFNHEHYIDSTYECSECNIEEPLPSDYCLNCGARMDGEVER